MWSSASLFLGLGLGLGLFKHDNGIYRTFKSGLKPINYRFHFAKTAII
jgi:hypothetical protein